MAIGLGRRKEARAKVKLIPGTGEFIINESKSNIYINQNLVYRSIIFKPLESLSLEKNYDVKYGLKKARKASQFSKR